jgi:hypothetical protein
MLDSRAPSGSPTPYCAEFGALVPFLITFKATHGLAEDYRNHPAQSGDHNHPQKKGLWYSGDRNIFFWGG